MISFLNAFLWLITVAWIWRVILALLHLPKLPDLLATRYAKNDHVENRISVIVPARNEAAAIEQTLRSLLAQQKVTIEIIAVDDRSTDATGQIMDRIAAEDSRLRVIHVDHLPEGWTGKTHAMALAARQSTTQWLLFTDGDILFAPDCLHRALSYANAEADHLVLFPSLILKSFGERMMLSAIQVLSFLSWRPWKIADPKSRDSIGVGAFNLVRGEVYRSTGGFEALRMEVLEDLRFGHEVKRQGFRQRFVFGRGLIRVHWAEGALGIIRNLTKNIFAVFRFRPERLLGACIGLSLFCLAPVAALAGPVSMKLAGIVALASAFAMFLYCRRNINGISPLYVFTFPIAACLLVYMLLRSMIVTLARGGVIWRGTFYPLAELRKQAGPLR